MSTRRKKRAAFAIGKQEIAAGRSAKVELPIAALVSGTPIALPVQVMHGAEAGPTIALTAALHGDELCGVEIIRRVLSNLAPADLHGTVVAVPVVNVHGFNTGDRYLPDRRDLNRLFPGSTRGSIGSRIAKLLMTEVVARADVLVDLHTGSDHRTNLPQIRGNLDDERTSELAQVFAAPVALHAKLRDGSLRAAVAETDGVALLYEAGEADRFDEWSITAGVEGLQRLLVHLGLSDIAAPEAGPIRTCRSSGWSRASRSGILHLDVSLGDEVEKGSTIASIYDPFGKLLGTIAARHGGVIIGHTQRPLVNRGDAVVHIAR